MFRHENGVSLRGGAGPRGGETAGLDNVIERAAIDHQVAHEREGAGANGSIKSRRRP